MLLIAHRGNIEGPNPEKENHPIYLRNSIDQGYDVELDLWFQNGTCYLGHDKPCYEVNFDFLLSSHMWIHCKDYDSLKFLIQKMVDYPILNFFYHTNEDYVLTSQNYIWSYPGKKGNFNTICVMPEYNNNTQIEGFLGVCTDYVKKYHD